MTRKHDLRALPRVLLVVLIVVTGFGSTVSAGDRFGDSTATSSRICPNNTLLLGKYQSTGNASVLDSMRIWARYNDGGTDTIVACIYNSGGSLLGRSRDSVVIPNDVLNPYLLHFDNQSINISASTRYWIGIQLRASGSSTNSRLATASNSDSLFLGTDALPLEGSLPAGTKYLGSGVEAIRITAYYSVHGAGKSAFRRRRTGMRAEGTNDEGRKLNETFVFWAVAGALALVDPKSNPGNDCDRH